MMDQDQSLPMSSPAGSSSIMPNTSPTLTFVIGASRSGTTWLARALGSDERVVATYETHLFNAYLGPLLATWNEHRDLMVEQAERWRDTGHPPDSAIGLPYVMDSDQLIDSLRRLVDDVFESVVKARPGVEAIVEKTPSHSGFVEDIDLLTSGQARFVHIIRNGYDAVESTLRAGAGWASSWAPRDPATAARKWASGVTGARQAARFEGRYYELRYEDLVAEPEQQLLEVLRFIGIDADLAAAARALERTDEGLFLGGEARIHFNDTFPEPKGFRRTDRRDRSARNRAIVGATVGPLLEELGYADAEPVSDIRHRAWQITGVAETGIARLTRLADRVRSDIDRKR